MKLRRPPLQIDPETPFKGALFQREQFARSLTALIKKSSDGMVVFVNGPWGVGKTTFSRMWRAHLEKEKLTCIYFDAYASDYINDPFVSFAGEIHALLKNEISAAAGVENVTQKFRDAAVNLAKTAAPLAGKVLLKLATGVVIGEENIKQLSGATKEISDGIADSTETAIRQRIEKYDEERKTLENFRDSLKEVADLVREKQGMPLTILVDELDRCRPSFALELLERIKHLFDVPGVVFVLLVNQAQIESYIRAVYGERVEASSYLQKFGDLFVELPCNANNEPVNSGLREFLQTLLEELDVNFEPPSIIATDLAFFCEYYDLTLREAEHVVRTIAIDRASLTDRDFRWFPVREFFAIIKIKKPELFSRIRDRSTTGDEATKLLELPELKKRARNESIDHLAKITAVLIHSELSKHPDEQTNFYLERLVSSRVNARSIASQICAGLDRFRYLQSDA